MTPEERAAQSILILIASTAADTAGSNYSPCLRDCVHDARGWVGPMIAQALIAARNEALEEAAKVVQNNEGADDPWWLPDYLDQMANSIRNLKTKEG